MLKETIQDQDGRFSSTRMVMYATAATVLLTYIAHNVVSMIKGGGMVDFALNSVIVLGIAMTGKVAQKFTENGKKSPSQ